MKEIQVYLTGRLGNQLFQYAMAKNIQKKYGGKIVCNIYDLEHISENLKHTGGKFNYELKNYTLNDNIEIIDKKLPWYVDLSNSFIKIIKKIFPKLYFRIMAKKGYLIWQRDEFVKIPKLNAEKILLYGWWQDFRFFDEAAEDIRSEIVPKTKPNINNKYIYDLAELDNGICISIRGGNYLYPTIRKKLFVCDKEYFYNAIKVVKDSIKNPKFVIFSDDLDWVKRYMNFEEKFKDCEFYYETGNDTVEEKLRMMSQFKNFIISNSSFSWWAQYLSKKDNKYVIAPDRWFTNGNRCGLYMDNWTVIDTEKEREK